MSDEQALLDAAWQVREKAYAPYSQFRVGAAILLENGAIFTGCNVENASYGGTVCAERVAIHSAVAAGSLQPGGLLKVVVATDTARAVSPCGICRQSIEEFAASNCQIIMSREPSEVAQRASHKDLLPFSFNQRNLDH